MTPIVVLGGRLEDLPTAVAAGDRPNVEILELIGRHGMPLCSYDDLPSGGWLRRIAARCGQHWALGLLTVARYRHGEVLIATGEDVGFPMVILHGLLRRRRRRARVAVIAHGSYLNSRRAALVGRLVRHREDVLFLSLSTAVSALVVERLGLRPSQVVTVGYGTDLQFFRPVAHERSDRMLVSAAGTANRDYRTLVEAMRDVPGDLKIAADSAWFRTPIDVDGDELPAGVELRSFGDYRQLRDLYARSDVIVVPLYEARHACGYAVIAEGMAMGRPVIATRTEGHSDLLEDGVTGWYVEPGDVEALRDRLRQIDADQAMAEEIGAKARAAIVARDSVDAVADRIAAAATTLGAEPS